VQLPLAVNTQPVAELQLSSVQLLLSLQVIASCVQEPAPSHTSFVHASLSLVHAVPLLVFVWAHPVIALHESVVHGLPSSQLSGVEPTHVPPEHASTVVHTLLSSHEFVLFVYTQLPAAAVTVISWIDHQLPADATVSVILM
jgi:hypothetical protein